jgi:hypothetical protein
VVDTAAPDSVLVAQTALSAVSQNGILRTVIMPEAFHALPAASRRYLVVNLRYKSATLATKNDALLVANPCSEKYHPSYMGLTYATEFNQSDFAWSFA